MPPNMQPNLPAGAQNPLPQLQQLMMLLQQNQNQGMSQPMSQPMNQAPMSQQNSNPVYGQGLMQAA